MSLASLTASASLSDASSDLIVLGVVSGTDGARFVSSSGVEDVLTPTLAAIEFSGDAGETRRIPAPSGLSSEAVLLVGLGADHDATSVRDAAGTALRVSGKDSQVALDLGVGDDAALLAAAAVGAGFGSYRFVDYAPTRAAKLPQSREVAIVSAVDAELAEAVIARARVVAESSDLLRNLVNTPANDLGPVEMADLAAAAVDAARAELAEGATLDYQEWDEDALIEGGYGGILAVAAGSDRPARLLKIDYVPATPSRHVALVGKGITFDTGGLSLKPPSSMIGMKYDMTGAATVLAAALAAARLGSRQRVTAWLCLAENMPSGRATRPGDVLTTLSGTTVEVLNTDAEGRLVLADGLTAASRENPDLIVDVATLTGAARMMLGERTVPAMGDLDEARVMADLAASVGEAIWPMPIPAELRPMLASSIADIANIKDGGAAPAGTLIASAFLRDFIGDTEAGDPIPWVHLDIAACANNSGSGFGVVGRGPTATMLRTLIETVAPATDET